jgi:hypothetical protein
MTKRDKMRKAFTKERNGGEIEAVLRPTSGIENAKCFICKENFFPRLPLDICFIDLEWIDESVIIRFPCICQECAKLFAPAENNIAHDVEINSFDSLINPVYEYRAKQENNCLSCEHLPY